ncbi:MAG TPA: stage II sporulation protein M [Capillibacterium sp.]
MPERKLIPAFPRAYRMMLAFSAFSFLLSIAGGYRVWAEEPALAKEIIERIIETKFAVIVEQMSNTGWWGQVFIIFGNNLKAAVLILLSGLFLPILPLVMGIMSNGMMIGLMLGFFEAERLVRKSTFFLSLLPHGIFEVPAILLSATAGVIWGARSWRSILGGGGFRTVGDHARENLPYLPLIIVLFFIAALMEVLVTPRLAILPSYA